MKDALTFLVCPDCRRKLVVRGQNFKCAKCKRSFRQSNRNIEMLPSGFSDNKWIHDEMLFWEKEYASRRNLGGNNIDIENRLTVRKQMIDYLLSNKSINSMTKVLDIGCGDGYTTFYLLNPDKKRYTYIALDASQESLNLLRSKIKHVTTVRSLLENSPFLPKSFDIIFAWGTLHHTEKKEQTIDFLTKLLKKGGYLMLFEGLEPQTLLLKISRYIMQLVIRESEHEERIDEKNMFEVLQKSYNIVWYKHEYTPFRSILILIASKLGVNDRSGNIIKGIINLDNLIINSFGRLFKSFSGGAVSVIAVKK